MAHIPIKALLVPDTLKGYVFIEADGPHLIEEAIAGVRHVRSRIPGLVDFSEVERCIRNHVNAGELLVVRREELLDYEWRPRRVVPGDFLRVLIQLRPLGRVRRQLRILDVRVELRILVKRVVG